MLLKYVLLGLAALALVIAGLAAYLAATFDARDYHARIVEIVKAKTGRTLSIEGDIDLALWPQVAVRIGALSLTERGSDERFASVESARLALELRPLLSGAFIANEMVIEGAQLSIVRDAHGRLNIEDLLQGAGGAVRFDIGRIALERAALAFRDLASGARYELTGIGLETGRIVDTQPTPVDLAFKAQDIPETFELDARVKARLTVDAQNGLYSLHQSAIELAGRVPGMSNLSAHASGDIAARFNERDVTATRVSATLTGRRLEETLEIRMKALRLFAVPGKAHGEDVEATLIAAGTAGTTQLEILLPRVERTGDHVAADAATGRLAMRRGEHTIAASLAAPIVAAIAARTVTLRELDARFVISGPRLPAGKLSGAVRGSASVDFEKEGVQLNIAGKVAASRVKARLAAAGFAAPVYTFAVHVDEIDLARYTAAEPRPRKRAPTALDFAPLAALPASGTLNIGVLKSADTKASNVRLTLKP